jgi:glycerol-3-phosphate dehydrogenase (NAD(P)+)
MAALITRGLREIARLAVACGGRDRTLSGLSGMGDLVLTCTGALSRNKTVGMRLARGERLEEILRTSTQVAEGVRTTRSVNRLAERLGVEVPIAATVEQVLYEDRDPHEALRELMGRQRKGEFE